MRRRGHVGFVLTTLLVLCSAALLHGSAEEFGSVSGVLPFDSPFILVVARRSDGIVYTVRLGAYTGAKGKPGGKAVPIRRFLLPYLPQGRYNLEISTPTLTIKAPEGWESSQIASGTSPRKLSKEHMAQIVAGQEEFKGNNVRTVALSEGDGTLTALLLVQEAIPDKMSVRTSFIIARFADRGSGWEITARDFLSSDVVSLQSVGHETPTHFEPSFCGIVVSAGKETHVSYEPMLPVIAIESHFSGEEVTEPSVILRGHVVKASAPLKALYYAVIPPGATDAQGPAKAELKQDDDFEITLALPTFGDRVLRTTKLYLIAIDEEGFAGYIIVSVAHRG